MKPSDAAMRAANVIFSRYVIDAEKSDIAAIIDAETKELVEACGSAVQTIEQLIPEESVRGVANLVLFQLRSALAKFGGGE